MATPRLRLGQLLVDARMLTPRALEDVLALQRTDGRRLGTLLVEQGLVNETQLTQILSHQLAVPWVSLLHIEFSRQLLDMVPREVAERYCLVPIYVRHVRNQGETLYVAMDDPTNEEGLRECTVYSGLPVRAMIAPPSDIRSAIRVYYNARARSVAPQAMYSEPPKTPPTQPAPKLPLAERADDAEAAALAEAAREGVAGEADGAAGVIQAQELDDAETAALQELADAGDRPTPVGAGDEEEAQEDVETSGMRPTMELGPSAELIAESRPDRLVRTRPLDAEFMDPLAPAEPAEAPAEAAEAPPEAVAAPESAPPAPPPESGAPPARRRRPGAAVLLNAVLGRTRPAASEPPAPAPVPRSELPTAPEVPDAQPPRARGRRMVALTLLDGTTIKLPARGKAKAPSEGHEAHPSDAGEAPGAPASGPHADEAVLTARDLVAALRAVSHGADASEVLGGDVRWEAMFAALLSLLLKKHLIADWEFVDELKKF